MRIKIQLSVVRYPERAVNYMVSQVKPLQLMGLRRTRRSLFENGGKGFLKFESTPPHQGLTLKLPNKLRGKFPLAGLESDLVRVSVVWELLEYHSDQPICCSRAKCFRHRATPFFFLL